MISTQLISQHPEHLWAWEKHPDGPLKEPRIIIFMFDLMVDIICLVVWHYWTLNHDQHPIDISASRAPVRLGEVPSRVPWECLELLLALRIICIIRLMNMVIGQNGCSKVLNLENMMAGRWWVKQHASQSFSLIGVDLIEIWGGWNFHGIILAPTT